jgi:endo-1,4-beta-xylanase
VTLVSVVSNEPESGFLGNGDEGPDIQGASVGTDDRTFSLRSERGTGGQSTGRVYTITYRATDLSGNNREVVATVTVPTNNSGR